MWMKSIQADNFKSLIKFQLDVAPFTCLIGLNGSGKSTVLQFIDFLSQLVRRDLTQWLEERHWRANELTSRFTHKKIIWFRVSFVSEATGDQIEWSGRFNTTQLHCTGECISTAEAELLVTDCHLSIRDRRNDATNGKNSRDEPISFNYQGSVLSQLRPRGLPHSLVEFKDYIASIKSFDLLSPQYLRQRTRESTGSIGLGGQRLSAYLHELGADGREQLRKRLRKVYKHLKALDTKSLRSGWKQLLIEEGYSGGASLATASLFRSE